MLSSFQCDYVGPDLIIWPTVTQEWCKSLQKTESVRSSVRSHAWYFCGLVSCFKLNKDFEILKGIPGIYAHNTTTTAKPVAESQAEIWSEIIERAENNTDTQTMLVVFGEICYKF